MRAKKNGFTLVEVLVVLVLLSLISSLAFEILHQTANLRGQFLDTLEELQQGVIREHWFRSSVAALTPDYPPEQSVVYQARKPYVFVGNEKEFFGLTINALDNDGGIPTPFGWQLEFKENETILRYRNSEEQWWEIMRWVGKEGVFFYQAKDGTWHKQWPPIEDKQAFENLDDISKKIAALDKPAQIPKTILLDGKKDNHPFAWIVRILGKDRPHEDPLISIQKGNI
jgi:prepilin-type N-terminal cleavage/methylation domain-containing protein